MNVKKRLLLLEVYPVNPIKNPIIEDPALHDNYACLLGHPFNIPPSYLSQPLPDIPGNRLLTRISYSLLDQTSSHEDHPYSAIFYAGKVRTETVQGGVIISTSQVKTPIDPFFHSML